MTEHTVKDTNKNKFSRKHPENCPENKCEALDGIESKTKQQKICKDIKFKNSLSNRTDGKCQFVLKQSEIQTKKIKMLKIFVNDDDPFPIIIEYVKEGGKPISEKSDSDILADQNTDQVIKGKRTRKPLVINLRDSIARNQEKKTNKINPSKDGKKEITPNQKRELSKLLQSIQHKMKKKKIKIGLSPIKNERGKYECDQCKKEFTTPYATEYHKKFHKRLTPFQCKICSRKFKSKSNLVSHMTIHSGQRPHKCEDCKFSFRLKSDLVRHICKHTGEKSFSCKICNKKFAVKSTLTVHNQIHQGDRHVFTCKKCQKTYTCRQYLKNHILSHHHLVHKKK